jgi:uncharacterized membrane protein
VWIAAVIYVVAFTLLSVYRYSLMGDSYSDLSIFEQSFSSTVNEGLPLYNSQEGEHFFGRVSHFSVHVAPFLFLWAPVYWMWQGPESLLFAKTVAIALGAFPLYKLASLMLGSSEAGWLVAVMYMLYPPVHGVNMGGFHENEFAMAPLMFLLLGYQRRSWKLFWVSLLVALSVKETIALTTAAFGLYLIIFRREKTEGIIVMAISVVWLFVAQWILIPFTQGRPLMEMDDRVFRSLYLPSVGQSYGEIFWNIVRHPLRIAHFALGHPYKRAFLIQLFFPLAFLPFTAPETLLISAPVLAQNLLTVYRVQFSLIGQYNAEIIPFLFYGLCLGIARIERIWTLRQSRRTHEEPNESAAESLGDDRRVVPGILRAVLAVLLVANLFSGVWSFALGQTDFLLAIAKPPERRKAALELMARIPKDASVFTDVSMISHLGGHVWLHGANREAFFARDWDYVLLDSHFPWIADIQPDALLAVLEERHYKSTVLEGVVLFKRPGAPE